MEVACASSASHVRLIDSSSRRYCRCCKAVGPDVLGFQLRFPSGTLGASGRGTGTKLHPVGASMGCRFGPREILRCARLSPALSAGEIPAPERGRATPPGIESWAHEGNDMS